jgi:hypothetical protein
MQKKYELKKEEVDSIVKMREHLNTLSPSKSSASELERQLRDLKESSMAHQTHNSFLSLEVIF